MKKLSSVFFIMMSITLFECCIEPESSYFERGELSSDDFKDSVLNRTISARLIALNEPPLKTFKNTDYLIRLLVRPAFFNSYCIRIERSDSVYRTTFKILGDQEEWIASGLANLSFTYESKHERMDSLFNELHQNASAYDFYPGLDHAKFVGADGIGYLLEQYDKGRYQVVVGWDGGDYKGKRHLMSIVKDVHLFVPSALIPNANPYNSESSYFTVFRRDSVSAKQVN